MSGARLHTLLPELTSRQPVMVVGAAVIDVIADAYALPWRGCAISNPTQQALTLRLRILDIAVALKRLGIPKRVMPCRSVRACGRRLFATRMAKEG